MSAPPPPLHGRYRLDALLGQGGFARVYLATDLRLRRQVAVKILDPNLVSSDESRGFLARFEREAQAVASLDHPNILGIFDYGEDQNLVYLVMPYIAGSTLDRRLRAAGGRLDPAEAMHYLRGLADALDYAHGLQIVHRDIKPQNVLLRTDHRPLLADFGIAKMLREATANQSRSQIVGTLPYMAPEQFRGEVGPATDVYALACMLMQLLTGTPPYAGTTEQILFGHAFGEIPQVSVVSSGRLPATLDPVFTRALAKQPEARYQRASELWAACAQALAAAQTPAVPRAPQPAPAPTPVVPGGTPVPGGSAATPAPGHHRPITAPGPDLSQPANQVTPATPAVPPTLPPRMSRRAFLIGAGAVGLSATVIGGILVARGLGGGATPTSTAPAGAPGAVVAATTTPTAPPRPTPVATSAVPGLPSSAPVASMAPTPTSTVARPPTPTSAPPTATPPPTVQYTRDSPPAVPNAAQARAYSGQRLTFVGSSATSAGSTDTNLVQKFVADTGIQVNFLTGPTSATERYASYQRTFQAQSPDLDAILIDVIWPAAFAPYLVDLNPQLGDLAKLNYASVIQNNTVGGKLVGMPWYGDFGMLYYRTDLLQKYGLAAPPKTWQELQQAAQTIQDGEKGANPSFIGFAFQGNAYEGLTSNALEWFASNGAGTFIENGTVTINNPTGVEVLNVAKSFVGTVSPRGVTSYQETETAQFFTGGNAAFARNWPYMYAAANEATSAIKGKFAVAALPAAAGGSPVGTVGGWQLGVSRYSKAQDAAIEFVRYLCSPEVVTWRGVVDTYVPVQPAVNDHPQVQANQPYLKSLAGVERVARPSNALGENYNQGSTAIFQAFNQALAGGSAQQALQSAHTQLERLVRR